MPNLLDIPQEIRDQIIEFAITHSVTPPRTPEQALESGQYAFPNDMLGWLGQKCKSIFGVQEPTMYPIPGSPLAPSVDPTNLLLTCKRLNEETLDSIKRISRDFEADLMLVDEKYLIATWTFVPPYSPRSKWFTKLVKRQCENVNFIIRPFGIWNDHKLPKQDPQDQIEIPINAYEEDEGIDQLRSTLNGFSIQRWHSSTTVPGTALTGFSITFERFLRGGATGMPFPSPDFDARLKLCSATIMIMSPEGVKADEMFTGFSPHLAPQKRKEEPDKASWMMHPSTIRETLEEWFKAVPSIEVDPNQPKNLTTYFNKLDKINFGVDGKLESIFLNTQRQTGDNISNTWEPWDLPDSILQ